MIRLYKDAYKAEIELNDDGSGRWRDQDRRQWTTEHYAAELIPDMVRVLQQDLGYVLVKQ